MAKRAKVGIPFNYDESWIGGTYYIRNVISALNTLPENEKPYISILSHSANSYKFIAEETAYPHLNWLMPCLIDGCNFHISRFWRYLYKLFPYVGRLFPKFIKQELDFDMVFPSPISKDYKNTVCWIPDFQDKRLPEFFTGSELEIRVEQHRQYATNARGIVFSSKNALDDFEHFYPEYDIKKSVVRFAVFNNIHELPSFVVVREKYGLPELYFYCPNQFWIHKNHPVVIKALGKLVARYPNICLVMSGKEHDHRAPHYLDDLKTLCKDLGVTANVRFLGFLPRDEQLSIMKNARLVIQPSLFEGWSTVIEDAKSMSQYVLASDIDIHHEQLTDNGEFFSVDDYSALAGLIEKYIEVEPLREKLDYRINQRQFAEDFVRVIDNI